MSATAHAISREIITPHQAESGVALRARGIAKRFGSAPVLEGLNLNVPAGQFLAIVGRSGSGKSTLLRILAGLEIPSAGSVAFGGTPGGDPGDFTRVMFQEPRLLPWARVLANVEVGHGRNRNAPGAREASLAALAAVGLEDRADDWPAVLSGGQKQRVALARALVSRPLFMAFDEPLGALDALTRIEMQQLIESVWIKQKFTAVLITHDVAEALMLGDRVAMIEDGAIRLDLAIDLPRPRRRASLEFAAMEEQILTRLLSSDRSRARA
jgi:sulfonate transport system ATP-binding protein